MQQNLKIVPSYIYKFINTDKWENAQVYNIGNKKGMTDYIDFIQPRDFPEKCNLMYGIDCYNRFFLTHCYKDTSENNYVMTLFQRYSDQHDFFVNGGDSLNECGVKTSSFSSDRVNEYHKLMFDLINNGSINIVDDYNNNLNYTSVIYNADGDS
jgi:hypothetical protein